jgi:hypothetical protein
MAGARRRHSEASLRAELEQFTAGRDDWPSLDELIAAGRPDLANAVRYRGGSMHWARQLGKQLNKHQVKGRLRWTPEEVESELRAFIGDAQSFPLLAAFLAADRYDLYAALKSFGGVRSWHATLGMKPDYRRISDADLEEELRAVTADSDDWPTMAQFRRAGLARLSDAMRTRGGSAYWAERLGKTLSAQQLGRARSLANS